MNKIKLVRMKPDTVCFVQETADEYTNILLSMTCETCWVANEIKSKILDFWISKGRKVCLLCEDRQGNVTTEFVDRFEGKKMMINAAKHPAHCTFRREQLTVQN